MARLNYLFDHRRRAGIVLGASGVGKTSLLSRFAREVRRAGHEVVSLELFGTPDGEFLWNLASRLGANVQTNDSRLRLWKAVTDRLYENRLQGLHTAVLLDDVDQAHPEVVTLITKLLQAERAGSPAITCLLTADPEHLSRVSGRLQDLVELRVDLEPWSLAETVKYIESPGANAGRDAVAFTPAALERLHEITGGVPRKITQLAELSQLAATISATDAVEPFTVENVFGELSLGGFLQST